MITDGTNDGGLKTYGNYMVSMPPDSQLSEYVSWGYWEAAYVDPTSLAEYHIHQPGSLWIAGERTPVGYVQGLIDGNDRETKKQRGDRNAVSRWHVGYSVQEIRGL